ncbi:MAG TPA: IS1595 family transposase [Dehalococcoidia bacterium]|nr:IS1595 family transposase [Dehalococcoidia bacterium]
MADQAPGFLSVARWTDDQCRDYLERRRWPSGPVCPKCGDRNPYSITRKSRTKNVVKTLYRCRACRKDYTVTVGTIFEDSHIPLIKWFAAIYLMVGSKKGISSHQLHRELELTYRSAWFMSHRIREAIRDKNLPFLTGTIEADETYIGGKPRGHRVWRERARDEVEMGLLEKPRNRAPSEGKLAMFGILERDGRVRSLHVDRVTAQNMRSILLKNIDKKTSRLMTDRHPAYRPIRRDLPHSVIGHELTYVDPEHPDIHTQAIEGYWSLLKRGIYGVFHHVSSPYLGNYLKRV